MSNDPHKLISSSNAGEAARTFSTDDVLAGVEKMKRLVRGLNKTLSEEADLALLTPCAVRMAQGDLDRMRADGHLQGFGKDWVDCVYSRLLRVRMDQLLNNV